MVKQETTKEPKTDDSVVKVKVRYWQQETAESGTWKTTDFMPNNMAIDFCKNVEKGEIISA